MRARARPTSRPRHQPRQRAWIKDFESCTLLMSRGALTIGVAHAEDPSGLSYWAVVSSEARTKFKQQEVVSGSHELLPNQPGMVRFSAMYFNPAVDDSLKVRGAWARPRVGGADEGEGEAQGGGRVGEAEGGGRAF